MSLDVQADWQLYALREFIKLTPGWPFKSNKFTQDPREGRPLVRIRDLNSQAPAVFTPEECDARYLVKQGDHLIGMDGEFLAVKWSGPEALLNQRVLKITSADQGLEGNFLFYRIQPELSKIEGRTGLTKMLRTLRRGDTLTVWRLDRLGRSLFELLKLVRDLNERGVEFRSLSESLDTSTSAGRLLLHVLASMAEFERSLISERTRAGMAAARARGSQIGRRPAMTAEQLADARRTIERDGRSVTEIADKYKVHPRTLSRLLKENEY